MRHRSGFTLIELLVVIAIISIIAGILFPVFAQAREKARQTTCISNLKQLSYGLLMYADDWDEALPQLPCPEGMYYKWKPPKHPGPPSEWFVAIQPYVKNKQVFRCPSAGWKGCCSETGFFRMHDLTMSDPGIQQWISWIRDWDANANPVNYGYNWYLGTIGCNADKPAPTLGVISEPSRTMLVADASGPLCASRIGLANPETCGYISNFECEVVIRQGLNQSDWPNYTRHNQGDNVAFVDGHAKWMRISQSMSTSGEMEYPLGTSIIYFPPGFEMNDEGK